MPVNGAPPVAAAGPIDWSAAVRAGHRLAPTGPAVSPAEAAVAVDDLRSFSGRAELIVRDTTGIGHGLPLQDADVVDRRGWIEATAAGMELLTIPLTGRLSAKATPGPTARAAAGAQVGVLLGFLSGRVLGQYDPLTSPVGADPADPPGRLLLVAPNIVRVERDLKVDPGDFRMWVCLHESTHRLQFTAVPWLREHFVGLVSRFGEVADVDSSELLGRMTRAVKGGRQPGESWIEKMQTPEQREIFDAMMGLMSLLEGHADHVMDAVGPRVVPTVSAIRGAFSERRRKGRSPLDRLLRSVLGMDMKMAQYVKGEKFVSALVDRHGMDGFNRIWDSPETLPTRAEISDPDAWTARVLT